MSVNSRGNRKRRKRLTNSELSKNIINTLQLSGQRIDDDEYYTNTSPQTSGGMDFLNQLAKTFFPSLQALVPVKQKEEVWQKPAERNKPGKR